MALALIAACGRGNVIGANNALPWHLPADLRRFKVLTMGCPIIMGRKTHDSIGRALPGRRNIVISRSGAVFAGCDRAASLGEALQLAAAAPRVFVVGGGEIYRQAVPLAQRLYITEVQSDAPGDVFFPPIDAAVWKETAREAHPAADAAPAYAFVEYERVEQ